MKTRTNVNLFGRIARHIAAGVVLLTHLLAPAASRADVFTNVPEAGGFQLVYSLQIPNKANYVASPTPYSVDNHLNITGPFDRIAYYLEVITPGGPPQYVYASMDAFTQDLNLIGIPRAINGSYFQRNVRNMNVASNVPAIVTGIGLTGGNIEFWRSNYSADNVADVPNADNGAYDFGDNAGGPSGGGTYGSFQIHNHDARQTLFAYNRWNDGVNPSDLGIGNNTENTYPDWTFRGNAGSFAFKTLQILVRRGPRTRAAIMPIGDSITYGEGGVGGGYRDRLFNNLNAAGLIFEFIGSDGGNPSVALTNSSQVNHEGHNGYRINQIGNNLSGNDGAEGNNGGFWFNKGVQPDIILLHIGTNDMWQRYNPGAKGKSAENTFLANLKSRLNSLVNQITTARPSAHVLVASIIPMNFYIGGRPLNPDVIAYNTYIQNVLVPNYQSKGRKVRFVDQYKNFVSPNGAIKSELLPDGLHPNQTGYDFMADTWLSAIQSLGF